MPPDLCPTCRPAYEDALAHGRDGRAHYIETRCHLNRHATTTQEDDQ